MPKNLFIAIVFLYLFFSFGTTVFASLPVTNSKIKVNTERYLPNQVIVKFKEQNDDLDISSLNGIQSQSADTDTIGKSFKVTDLNLNSRSSSKTAVSFSKVNAKHKIKQLKSMSFDKQKADELGLDSGFYVVTFEDNQNIDSKIEYLKSTGLFEDVTPDYVVSIAGTPNDPYYNNTNRDPNWNPAYEYQWNLKQIDMQNAWNLVGNNVVFVAVIDTGVDYTHQEFGSCSLTTISDGTCPTVFSGYDYYNNDPDAMDDNMHGTHVAGTINALTNNGVGIAGISPNAIVIPFKVLSGSGLGSMSNFIIAIQGVIDFQAYLRQQGYNNRVVINMSLGGNVNYSQMTDVLTTAYNNGIVVVAAGGNSNVNVNRFFPAGDTCAGKIPAGEDCVITVSAVDENDQRSVYSNYGDLINISAPGGSNDNNLLSLKTKYYSPYYSNVVGTNYLRISGTSMSTPHVSAVASMVLGVNPDLTVKQVQDIIYNGADYKTPDIYFGRGRLNAYKSMQLAVQSRYNIKDYDNNGVVNNEDATILASHIFQTNLSVSNPYAVVDLNSDGKVSLLDMISFL